MTQTSLEALTRQADDTLVVELRGDIDGDAREALGAASGGGLRPVTAAPLVAVWNVGRDGETALQPN